MCVFEKEREIFMVHSHWGDMHVVARANWTCLKDFCWKGKWGEKEEREKQKWGKFSTDWAKEKEKERNPVIVFIMYSHGERRIEWPWWSVFVIGTIIILRNNYQSCSWFEIIKAFLFFLAMWAGTEVWRPTFHTLSREFSTCNKKLVKIPRRNKKVILVLLRPSQTYTHADPR